MKNFKRFCAILLMACLTLSLVAGCGGDKVEWEEYDEVSYTTVPGEDKNNNKNDGTSSNGNNSSEFENMTDTSNIGRFENLNYQGKTIKYLIGYKPEAWEQQIYDEFEKMTGAKIKYIQEGTSSNKLAALIAANDAPDVYRMRQESFPNYITKKLVQPLNQFIADVRRDGGIVHFAGLMSDGRVHSDVHDEMKIAKYILDAGLKVCIHFIGVSRPSPIK